MEGHINENKLRKEISYLTRLIEAHKAIQTLQSSDKCTVTSSTTTSTFSTKTSTSSSQEGTSRKSRIIPGKRKVAYVWNKKDHRDSPNRVLLQKRFRSRTNSTSSSVILDKYRMLRLPNTRSNENPPTFFKRRLQYKYSKRSTRYSFINNKHIKQSTEPVHSFKGKRKRNCKHKVWIPDSIAHGRTNGPETSSSIEVPSSNPQTKTKQRRTQFNGAAHYSRTSGKSVKQLNINSGFAHYPKRPRIESCTYSKLKTSLAKSIVSPRSNRTWSRKFTAEKNRYCIFYNRFGHCNRGDKCLYIHDPKRVAVCNKFLRGSCNKIDGSCPFSHNVAKEKMPVCAFFLQGLCTRDNCPYLHVNLGPDTEICQNFVKGFCPLADKCKKRHDLRCLEYSRDGYCRKGSRCPLIHVRKRQKEKSNQSNDQSDDSVVPVKEPFMFKRIRRKLNNSSTLDRPPIITSPTQLITPVRLDFIPLQTNKVPDFIPL